MIALLSRFARDPRHYQMTVQAILLFCGLAILDFEITAARAVLTLAAVLGAQWACTRASAWFAARRVVPPGSHGHAELPPRFEWRSALISGLSLCLLLRTSSVALVLVTAFVTIASKFVLRWRGSHLFNPTCFGLVVMILVTPEVWVSPGQWGHATLLGFAIACLGSVVVTRAARADVTFAFLGAWAAILFGRAAWLGQPWATPLHMFTNGSILLFAFFMISDPRTTPSSRIGRVLFAVVVALGAGMVQFVLYRTNGPLWSLAVCALLVPLIDRWLPGPRHHWTRESALSQPSKGPSHAPALVPIHA
ncbi:MAG: RnfABCDGE type electron transport complex subunit D [Candidatus Eisenbacteria bacterium]